MVSATHIKIARSAPYFSVFTFQFSLEDVVYNIFKIERNTLETSLHGCAHFVDSLKSVVDAFYCCMQRHIIYDYSHCDK